MQIPWWYGQLHRKKVESTERNIFHNEKEPNQDERIRIVSTFCCDKDLVNSVKSIEKDLVNTKSFKPADNDNVQNKDLYSFVKKTGPNLKQKMVKLKQYAVGE